jgi:hypothetical protein
MRGGPMEMVLPDGAGRALADHRPTPNNGVLVESSVSGARSHLESISRVSTPGLGKIR